MRKKRKKKPMRKRRWFTATEMVEVCEPLAARGIDERDRTDSGQRWIGDSSSTGRVRGHPSAPRCRSSRALTRIEREEISRGIAAQQSMRSIAVRLGRAPSTVSREVRRNGGYDSYRASEADERTWGRARRRKSCRLARSPRLREFCGREATEGLVARANRRLAETHLPGQRVASRVTRDDLSQPFYPSPRGFEERTDGVSAL